MQGPLHAVVPRRSPLPGPSLGQTPLSHIAPHVGKLEQDASVDISPLIPRLKKLIFFTCNFWRGFTKAQGRQVTCLSVCQGAYQKVEIRAVTSLQLLSPPGQGRCGGTSGWSQLCMEDSSPCRCCTAAPGQLQKMTAGLHLHQSLTFESFLANGVLCEAGFQLLQPTELGHSMWFGRLSPCGMLQLKHTQSVVQGSVVAQGCSLNVGVCGVGVLGCSRAG